jgi:dethiobiotin synthetase
MRRTSRFGERPDGRAPDAAAAHPARGLFVTGTDTGVGKTIVASAIAATLAARGERVAVFKPVVTGVDEVTGAPPDHELLRASAHSGQPCDEISPYRFGPPVSPHLAARLAGVRVLRGRLVAGALRAATDADALIVEGVGGLAVPLDDDYVVRDLAKDLGLPLVIVGRPGLGTISHTLLTLEYARSAGLPIAGVVLTNWPDEPSVMEVSNRETIEAIGQVAVTTLGPLYTGPPVNPNGDLPVDEWLAPPSARAGAQSPPAEYSTMDLSMSHSTGARSSV